MLTALVVNGEKAHFDRMQAALEGAGCGAVWSANPAEALRLAHREPPTVIILDYAIAGMNASEVILLLKQDSRTARIPLLLLCNRSASGLLDGLNTDADMVLEKPVDLVEFVAVVQRLAGIRLAR